MLDGRQWGYFDHMLSASGRWFEAWECSGKEEGRVMIEGPWETQSGSFYFVSDVVVIHYRVL